MARVATWSKIYRFVAVLSGLAATAIADPAIAQEPAENQVQSQDQDQAQTHELLTDTSSPVVTPEVPRQLPEPFAVMAFENRSGVSGLEWLGSAVPFMLAEKLAELGTLRPAFGPLVLDHGRPVTANAEQVVSFASRHHAVWVWTGWLRRPDWDFELAISLWRVDGDQAKLIGSVVARDDFKYVHRMVGDAIVQLSQRAGLAVPRGALQIGQREPTADFYAFTLFGRGVAALAGTGGRTDLEAAEKSLTRAVFIDPKLAEAQRMLGELYRIQDKPRHAFARADAAVELRPSYYAALELVADLELTRGKLDRVRELDRKLVELRPWDLDRRFALGKLLWQEGDLDGGLRELDRVVARRPRDVQARRILALIHAARGDNAALAAELEAVVQLDPMAIQPRLDLAAAYRALGRERDAMAAYHDILALDPTQIQALKFLGDLHHERGDSQKAIGYYRRAIKAKPGDPRAYFLLGAIYVEQGDDRSARRVYQRAQRFKAYYPEVANNLGAIAYREGKLSEAIWYLRRAVARDGTSARYHYNFALALSASRHEEEALREVTAGLRLDDGHVDLHYLHGVVLLRLGRAEEAAAEFARVLELDPDYADAAHNLAVLDEMRRRVEHGEVVREGE